MLNEILLRLTWFVYGSNEFSGPPWINSFPCPATILARPHRNSGCIEKPNGAYCRFPNMTLTHSVLTHCPNVESLDVWLEYGDCTGIELDLWQFPFADGDKYPPLKSLKLDGYKFGGLYVRQEEEQQDTEYCMGPAGKHEWDKSYWGSEKNEWVDETNDRLMRHWEEQGGKPNMNLNMWLQAMDWSELQELSINTGRTEMADAIVELPKRLTSLKHLHIDSLPFVEGLKNNTLESLRWVGTTRPGYLDTILSQQGQSLRKLDYRCNEPSCPYWPDHINMTALPLLASRLEHIGINLPRNSNGSWPLAQLSALARMSSLKSADLYFRMQVPCKENLLGYTHPNCGVPRQSCYATGSFVTPYLNATTAAYMFSYLRSENTSKNLTSVTFHTGDWNEYISAMIEPFIANRRSAVYCSVKEGIEVCEAENEAYWQGYTGGEWGWDGETWHVDNDFEDFYEAKDKEDVEEQERIKEKMNMRIESYRAN